MDGVPTGRLQPAYACSSGGEAVCEELAHAAAFDPVDRHYNHRAIERDNGKGAAETCPAQHSGDIERSHPRGRRLASRAAIVTGLSSDVSRLARSGRPADR